VVGQEGGISDLLVCSVIVGMGIAAYGHGWGEDEVVELSGDR
jgi:hypothetical protein